MVGLKGISAVLVMAFMIVVGCSTAPAVAATEQDVTFTVEDDELGISASLAVSVDWNSAVSVDKGVVAVIPYELSAGVGSVSIYIPLSELVEDWYWLDPSLEELEDTYIDIPVPTTPVGQVNISLSQSLTGIPSSVVSINVMLEAAVSALSVTCSSGNEDILTQTSTLRWTTWGEKSIQVDPDGASASTVVMTLQYELSVAVVATIFGYEARTLVPLTPIAAVTGSPTVSTSISMEEDLLSQYLIPIVVIGAIAVAAVAAAVLLKKRKGKKAA